MPDNLRITAPVQTNEGVGKTNGPKESANVAAVNPAKVAQPNAQEQDSGNQSLDLLLNLESVYGKFIQQLRRTPSLSKSLGKTLGDAAAAQERLPGSQEETSPLAQLVKTLPTTEDDVLENLRFQAENSTEFSGPFFQLLNLLSQKGDSAGFDLQLAGFLKAYDSFRNAGGITDSILRDLKNIADEIPTNYAVGLRALSEKITGNQQEGAAQEDLSVLHKEILPFLSRYVSRTNDYGRSRENISLLLHHTTMLEAGTKANLSESFRKLLESADSNLNLPDNTGRAMQALFAGELAKPKQKSPNRFLDSLVSFLQGSGKKENEAVLSAGQSLRQDVCNALLLDSSVYMPFTHLFLPIVCSGRYLFAQVWVEKGSDSGGSASPVSEEPLRLYLSFEIQALGYFEASLALTGKNAELTLGYPPALESMQGEIRNHLASIFQNDGLVLRSTELAPCRKPEIGQKILAKVEERRHAVNVTV